MTPEHVKEAASLLEQLEAARSFDVAYRKVGHQRRYSFLIEEYDTGGYKHEDEWVEKARLEIEADELRQALLIKLAHLEQDLKELGVEL